MDSARKTAYLLLDVVEGVGRVDREADQDDVRVGVRKGSETVVVFLASRIPQGQLDVLAINLDIGDIVLEDGGDVDLNTCISKYCPDDCNIARRDFLPWWPSTRRLAPWAAVTAETS